MNVCLFFFSKFMASFKKLFKANEINSCKKKEEKKKERRKKHDVVL